MRLRNAVAVAATTVVGAGTAAMAAGRYGSSLALRPSAAGPPPTGLVTVHGVSREQVVLSRTPASVRPGVWGLTGPGVHATVGPVLTATPFAVTRRLLGVQRGALSPESAVRLTAQAYAGDPGSALGLEFTEVDVPGELGDLPGWFLPGDRGTWVLTAHGLGATREHTLNLLPALGRLRFPRLVVSYRNDRGAPASADGLTHLGDTEWRDLDAAMRYALRHGANRLVLLGWSTGATMALRAAAESPVRDRVAGLVLDSPVLDWPATVRASVTARGLPGALAPLAVRATQGRTGLRVPPDATADPLGPGVPTLLFHGPGDTFAPWAASRALAARHPGTVVPRTVPDAPHAALWNRDPAGYEETLRRFLTPLM